MSERKEEDIWFGTKDEQCNIIVEDVADSIYLVAWERQFVPAGASVSPPGPQSAFVALDSVPAFHRASLVARQCADPAEHYCHKTRRSDAGKTFIRT